MNGAEANTDYLKSITKMIESLEEDKLIRTIEDFAEMRPGSQEVQKVIQACKKGIKGVAEKFESGSYFVGDIVYAGEIIMEIEEILKPLVGESFLEEETNREDTIVEEILSMELFANRNSKVRPN
ncbi:B12-binding domain-containing protein [Alkalibacter mobilis]|uniref:B12-binding domain-containing protein n=1 Tax=Alkalibacter mobilis TaxID=2787712 RepID=UPI0018A0AA34|nr:B12-binding domain-containing protein [Alkalibacter mobilis]MBF7096385.1 hypothetical protein [Alkalibacter mobilis]